MTSEAASARVRCRGSFTPGMKLLLYNDSQRNQDTRLRAQTREPLVNALDRHWNCTPSNTHGFAHGAHPRKLPQEWGSAAKRELLNSRDAAQAQAAHARWPPSPDSTEGIQELTRELKISDANHMIPKHTM